MLYSAVKHSSTIRRLACLALIVTVGVGAGGQKSVGADEGEADVERPSVQLEVTAVRTRIIALDSFRGKMDLRVRITNTSGSPLELHSRQFKCKVDLESATSVSPMVPSLITGSQAMVADASREGWLGLR